ncbi:MAG: GDSL-type esterase/lipase family protein [Bacteroidia bacterium]|nr:GDSL-type esterase/lipase family protein [Bacteroidia bacterium]
MTGNRLAEGFWVLVLASLIASGLNLAGNFVGEGFASPQPEASAEGPTLVHAPDSALVLRDTLPIVKPDTQVADPLARFRAACMRTREGNDQVRIAYFGDSMIEGDLLTETLRSLLQNKLGGTGVGFVPIVSQTYGFRRTVYHRFSEGWNTIQALQPRTVPHAFGISGEYFLATRAHAPGAVWVMYKGVSAQPQTQQFEEAYLTYGRLPEGKSDSARIIVTTDAGQDTLSLAGNQVINRIRLIRKATRQLKVAFDIPDQLPVYGVSFESPAGVQVDNFPARGATGLQLVRLPGAALERYQQYHGYDLVILHYGLNLVSADRDSYDNYARSLEQIIQHLRNHMPGADILVVSVSDKASRIKGVLQTDPSVPRIVAAQQQAAQLMGCGFLNLYEQMGGEGTIIKWASEKPTLARSDYAHPNRAGAAVLGELVYTYLQGNDSLVVPPLP